MPANLASSANLTASSKVTHASTASTTATCPCTSTAHHQGAGRVDSAWQAVLDSLSTQTPCAHETPHAGVHAPRTDDTCTSSHHGLSTAGSCTPLTCSTQSVPSSTPGAAAAARRDQGDTASPRSAPVLGDALMALPPPLLPTSFDSTEVGRSDEQDAATPSTTTLVPRSALSSVVLGPYRHASDHSFSGTPAMTAEDAGFCLSADVEGQQQVPPELCATLAAHDEAGDPLRCPEACGSLPLCASVTREAPHSLTSAGLEAVFTQPSGTLDVADTDDVGDGRDSEFDDRPSWRPSTFASAEGSGRRSTWHALVADCPTQPLTAAGPVAGSSTTGGAARCGTFYELYHVVNRTAAAQAVDAAPSISPSPFVCDLPGEEMMSVPVPSSACGAQLFVPNMAELEKVVPHGARLDPQTVGELCSFVLEDATAAAQTHLSTPLAVPPGDLSHNGGNIAHGTSLPFTALSPVAPTATSRTPCPSHEHPFGQHPSSLGSLPSAPSCPEASQAVLRPGVVESSSLRTMNASRNSSLSVLHGVPAAVGEARALHPEHTSPGEEKASKPRGVLSVQNLRAHKARLGTGTGLAPALPAGVSVATIDTMSSQRSVTWAAATGSRRPIAHSLKPTTSTVTCPETQSRQSMEEAFKKCQFLCLDDVKDAVVRACGEQCPLSPTPSATSRSPDPSVRGGSTRDISCDELVSTATCGVPTVGHASSAHSTTPLTSLTLSYPCGCAFPAEPNTVTAGAMDNDSALLLAAAFTNAQLGPQASGSPCTVCGMADAGWQGVHRRIRSSQATTLTGSFVGRRGNDISSSTAARPSSSLPCTAVNDSIERASVSFSMLFSTHRDGFMALSPTRDPLEQKVCAASAGWCDEDCSAQDCGLPAQTPPSHSLPCRASGASVLRRSFAGESIHTPMTETSHVCSLYPLAQCGTGSKMGTSHGTCTSFCDPLSSTDSRQAMSAPAVQRAPPHTLVLELSQREGSVAGSEFDTLCVSRPRRMFCASFESELADVGQLEKWAKLSAIAHSTHEVSPAGLVSALDVRQSHTEVMT